MSDFSGRWSTTFGVMLLDQRGTRITGTYRDQGSEGRLAGNLNGNTLRFRYSEAREEGTGVFRLVRHGMFVGTYTPRGVRVPRPWSGHRGWDGLWDTDYGRLRLFDERGRIRGCYSGTGHAQLAGRASGGELRFRYREQSTTGEGRFSLARDGESFSGTWRPNARRQWQSWNGRRTSPIAGVTWVMVVEAHWQKSLAEPDYAYGSMVREILARQPQVRVRQRFFHDAASLEHWCRELAYLAEPAILMIASHGVADGLSVHGNVINTTRVLASLRDVELLRLLHFSSCLTGLDGERALGRNAFPISGYTTSVDWGASALLELTYLDLMLSRGMSPAQAARALPKLVPYAGSRAPRGSPYRAAGFRFFPALKAQ